MNVYFEKEIINRKQLLETLEVKNDSLKVNTAAVDEEINNFILLSKDIENLSAAVNRSNAYFLNLAHTYGINYSDFTELTTAMHPSDMTTILKRNELNFFNQLILKIRPDQAIPYTAQ